MNDWFSVVEFYWQKYVKCLLTFNLLGKINVHVYLCKHVISKCYTSDSFQYYNINIYFTYFSAMYSLGLFWTIGLAKILSRAKKLEMSVTFKDGFQNLSLNEWHTLVGIVIVGALKWVTHLNVSHVSKFHITFFENLLYLKPLSFSVMGSQLHRKHFPATVSFISYYRKEGLCLQSCYILMSHLLYLSTFTDTSFAYCFNEIALVKLLILEIMHGSDY